MAGPIIHLLAARAWAEGHPDLIGCPAFYLGAIAPDAIHMRAGAGKADKLRTHLNNHGSFNLRPLADYARARKFPFDIGYLAHLLTDPFWCAAYREIPGLTRPDGHTDAAVYYAEMSRVEAALIDGELLELLKRAEPPADHPLLTAEEIGRWRDRVVLTPRAMAGEAEKNRYLTRAFVAAFIARAGIYLDDMMGRLCG